MSDVEGHRYPGDGKAGEWYRRKGNPSPSFEIDRHGAWGSESGRAVVLDRPEKEEILGDGGIDHPGAICE